LRPPGTNVAPSTFRGAHGCRLLRASCTTSGGFALPYCTHPEAVRFHESTRAPVASPRKPCFSAHTPLALSGSPVSAELSWWFGGRGVVASAAASSYAFSARVDQPVGFRSTADRRGSVECSVKLIYLCKLSDSLSITFQPSTLPLMEFKAKVASMCDLD